ncbi:3565_t:CDS:2, partial [Rhizophagus irregularis]
MRCANELELTRYAGEREYGFWLGGQSFNGLSEFIKEYAGLLVEIIEICALTIPLSSLNGPTHFRVTAELRR